MSDTTKNDTNFEENKVDNRPSYSRNEFSWENLASVEESRQQQLISEVYSIMNTGDDDRLSFIKKEWEKLSEDGIDPVLEEKFNQAVLRYETRQERLEEAVQAKQSLIEQAEALKKSTDWNKTAAKLQELQQQWKESGFAGHDTDQKLWEKFREINDYFFEKRSEHFNELTTLREKAKLTKEALIEEITTLKDSTDWKNTSVAIRDLMTKWKEAGFAGREHEDNLWEQFNEHRQHFYGKQREYFDSMRETHESAKKQKMDIIERAEVLVKDFNDETQRDSMEALFTEWKTVGHSGRDNEDRLWSQFRAIQDDFYGRIKNRGMLQRKETLENAENEIETLNVRIGVLENLNEKLSAKIEALQTQYESSHSELTQEEITGLQNNLEENKKKIEDYRKQVDNFERQLDAL